MYCYKTPISNVTVKVKMHFKRFRYLEILGSISSFFQSVLTEKHCEYSVETPLFWGSMPVAIFYESLRYVKSFKTTS